MKRSLHATINLTDASEEETSEDEEPVQPKKRQKVGEEVPPMEEPAAVPVRTLRELHPHPRDARICRHPDPSLHVYLLDGRPVRCSGTEFVSKFTPPFDKIGMVTAMFNNTHSKDRYKTKTGKSPYEGMTKKQIIDKWDMSAVHGTAVHYLIERYIERYWDISRRLYQNERRVLFLSPDAPPPIPGDRSSYPKHIQPEYLQYENYATNFFIFEDKMKRNGWKPYRVEWMIFNEMIEFAGCIDAVFFRLNPFTKEPEHLLVDWKTCATDVKKKYGGKLGYPMEEYPNNKLTKYFFQESLYAQTGVKLYGLNIVQVKAVVLQPDNLAEYDSEIINCHPCLQVYENNIRFQERVLKWFKDGRCETGEFPVYPEPLYSRS